MNQSSYQYSSPGRKVGGILKWVVRIGLTLVVLYILWTLFGFVKQILNVVAGWISTLADKFGGASAADKAAVAKLDAQNGQPGANVWQPTTAVTQEVVTQSNLSPSLAGSGPNKAISNMAQHYLDDYRADVTYAPFCWSFSAFQTWVENDIQNQENWAAFCAWYQSENSISFWDFVSNGQPLLLQGWASAADCVKATALINSLPTTDK